MECFKEGSCSNPLCRQSLAIRICTRILKLNIGQEVLVVAMIGSKYIDKAKVCSNNKLKEGKIK